MSRRAKREYLDLMRKRYHTLSTKTEQTELLNGVLKTTQSSYSALATSLHAFLQDLTSSYRAALEDFCRHHRQASTAGEATVEGIRTVYNEAGFFDQETDPHSHQSVGRTQAWVFRSRYRRSLWQLNGRPVCLFPQHRPYRHLMD